MRLVLALGGNALQRAGDDGTVESELARTRASLAPLAELLAGRVGAILDGDRPQALGAARKERIREYLTSGKS